MNIANKLRGLLIAAAALIAHAPKPADAQVVQPVYTRPSKGSALVVFNTANPSVAETSAVYDMSAFAEVQLDVTLVQTGGVTTVQSFNVSQLGRYIKIQASYDTVNFEKSVSYSVLGADTATGSFTALNSPGALQPVQPNPSLAITNAKLVMTPLPYSTTQYTRPSKGNYITVVNTNLSNFLPGLSLPSTAVLDMRGFASVSISASFTPSTCAYGMNLFVYGGNQPVEPGMKVVATANSVRPVETTTAYVVNVASDYIVIGGSVFSTGTPGGVDCLVNVTATPLPYNVPNDAFSRTAKAATIYTLPALGTDVAIATFERYQFLRIQNLGAGAATCGPGLTKPIELAAETVAGNGGVVTLNSYGGTLFCASQGGVATQVGVFTY